MTSSSGDQQEPAAHPTLPSEGPAQQGISVVLLGTGTPLPNPARACASTLVICGGAAFLVDTGRGFLNNLAALGMSDASAVFFTHFHSDHFAEFGEFMINRTIRGATQPVPVIGPPGTQRVISTLLDAYRPDNQYRQQHHGAKWDERGMQADFRELEPGEIYMSNDTEIRIFEVSHPPVSPAAGYRFEYRGHVAVISGDTVKVPAMTEMAKGADILVHDATQKQMVRGMIQFLKSRNTAADDRLAAMSEEMMAYHAATEDVAQVAAEAGVKKLVLTHLVPSIPPTMDSGPFLAGLDSIFKGKIFLGQDGMRINSWD